MYAAMVIINDGNAAVGADGDAGRAKHELPLHIPPRSDCKRERAVWMEYSYVAVDMVGHVNLAVGCNVDVLRLDEPHIIAEGRPQDERECAVWMEYLHTVVAIVGDGDHARIDRFGVRRAARCRGQRRQHRRRRRRDDGKRQGDRRPQHARAGRRRG